MSAVPVTETKKKRKVGDGTPGPGRPKGTPNKVTSDLRNMVLAALEGAGGQAYLITQAKKNPGAFLALVGKCMPKDINLNAKVNLAELLREARERVGKR